ncbi:MAG: SCP2 sterol-binding domain-containing protein [Acidimicrobiales bacterium]
MTLSPPFSAVSADTADDEIEGLLETMTLKDLVDAGMATFCTRFDPAAAGSLDGVIQWEVGDPTNRERQQLVVDAGACHTVAIRDDDDEPPRRAHVLLSATPIEFVRVVAGVADPIELFTAGRVLIAGNLPLARAFASWFPT